MTITSTKLPTSGTGMIEGKLADPHFSGEIKIAQAQAATSAATVYGSGKEGGSGEIIPPKKSTIDYRPRNMPQATILLTETSIRESMHQYPAKKANGTLIKNIKEWYADPRTKNSPQRKAVKAYIMAATAKPSDKPAKAASQTTSVAAGGTGGPNEPKKDKEETDYTKKQKKLKEDMKRSNKSLGDEIRELVAKNAELTKKYIEHRMHRNKSNVSENTLSDKAASEINKEIHKNGAQITELKDAMKAKLQKSQDTRKKLDTTTKPDPSVKMDTVNPEVQKLPRANVPDLGSKGNGRSVGRQPGADRQDLRY